MRHSRLRRGFALGALSLALLASACSSDDDGGGVAAGGSSSTASTEAPKGGALIFGAEQEPECMDWIGSCAGASWGIYTMGALTMPRVFDFGNELNGRYTITPLVAEEPKLETTPKQRITYKIKPEAVWSDGTPITGTDFKYTWDQIVNGKDIYDKTGYEKVESVEVPDPKTAVVTFKEPYPSWRDMFGGFYGVFPSHLLTGKDRNAEMKDGYKWSGGPWMLETWTKGAETKLVPNPRYWDKKPNVDSMTFKLLTDTAAAQSALRSGQVSMLYPQAQPGQEQLKTVPGIKFDAKTGLSYEALWFNTAAEPFTSKAVRQAVAYAIDRDAIVKQLFQPIQEDIKRIDSFATPAFGKNYFEPYKKYSPVQAGKVDELMTGDGWAKGPDGVWAKAGKRMSFEVKTTSGNRRRQQTLEIMQSQIKALGFDMTINPIKAGTLFGQDAPKGNFQAALYAQVPASNDPGLCNIFCSKNIPSAANENTGTNWYRLNNPAIDEVFTKIDSILDEEERTTLARRGQELVAEDVPAIPIDPFPDIIAYSGDVVGGDVKHNASFGPWIFANSYFVKKR